MSHILYLIAFLLWAIGIGFVWMSTRVCLRKLASLPPHADRPYQLYPITILKPLKGVDPGLQQNLESFFLLDYPNFELIFSVADAMDPARFVAEGLIKKYPSIDAKIIVGQEDVGINPKVNNLVRSYASGKHDLMVISDSNIRVRASYLKRLMDHMDQSVGVITSVVSGFSPKGLGAQLETIYLNTFYARGMSLAFHAGQPFVVGKSMFFKRSQANRFGGIKALGGFIAEDYVFGEMMRKLGLRVVLMNEAIPQFIGKYSLKDFWSRHLRWGRIRRAQAPIPFMIEPLGACIPSGLIGAFAFSHEFGISTAQFLLVHMTFWAICDFWVSLRLQGQTKLWLPLAWFVREILALPLWIQIALSHNVEWRGQKYRISAGGRVTLVGHENAEISLGSGYQRAPNRGA